MRRHDGPLRRRTLSELVEEQVRDWIISGELQPGEVAAPSEMARILGASRTPVVAALHNLAAKGLVDIKVQSSTTVCELEQTALYEGATIFAALAPAVLHEARAMVRTSSALAAHAEGVLTAVAQSEYLALSREFAALLRVVETRSRNRELSRAIMLLLDRFAFQLRGLAHCEQAKRSEILSEVRSVASAILDANRDAPLLAAAAS